MTKLVAVSDLHLDKETLGVPRFEEVSRCLRQAAEHAIAIEADAFLFLGDLSDPDSGGAAKRASAEAITVAMMLARAGVFSVWMAGNHDVEEDGTGATTLSPLAALQKWEHKIFVAEGPASVTLSGDVALALLPFASVARAYDPQAVAKSMQQQHKGQKLIVAAHLNIPGIGPGEETLEMPRGREVLFPIEATTRAAFRMSGHYHTRQDFDPGDGGPPIHVVGSPAAFAFGEHDGVTPAFSVIEL